MENITRVDKILLSEEALARSNFDWAKDYLRDLWQNPSKHIPEIASGAAVCAGLAYKGLGKLALAASENVEAKLSSKLLSSALENGEIKRTISDSSAEYFYHGTAKDFPQLVPKPNRRINSGEVIWSGEGVFATPDRRIAMIYTSKRVPGFTQGVNLIEKTAPDQPVTLFITGGKSREEAFSNLYGTVDNSTGFIHILEKKGFQREKGLGQMEVVSRTNPVYATSPELPTGIQVVNPRQEIENYVKAGRMQINWKRENPHL